MLLQSLLLLRVLIPVAHTVLHGVNDVRIEDRSALCDISDEASSDDSQRSASSVQFSVADMLASKPIDISVQEPPVTSAKTSSTLLAFLPDVALPGDTPPPQC
jgi:hypothetical protein